MDSSPGSKAVEPTLPSTAGLKRPAPSLLPAFEPLSSSPGLPRPPKRQARAGSIGANAYTKYPTPLPTSSTGILSSSPPRVGARPALVRTHSNATERAPLSTVPSIQLAENGETLLMGRSSNSSHYQLSANRLISRVHVKARYVPAPKSLELGKVEIICNGWNGLKLHCQGKTWELSKGDIFTSETENAEIMMDVQDARVRLHWPKKEHESLANLSDSSWDDSPRPRGIGGGNGDNNSPLQSSPLRRTTRIASPESPTPAHAAASSAASLHALLPATRDNSPGPQIQIYEDSSADEEDLPKHGSLQDAGTSFATEVTNSFSSDLSDPQSDDEDENNPDEENDPIIHSFGPFGANLSNRLASITTLSPNIRSPLNRVMAPGSPLATTPAVASATGALSTALASSPLAKDAIFAFTSAPNAPFSPAPAPPTIPAHISVPTITNHLVNQLAYSRLSSVPLSAIMQNLPAEERRDLSKECLRYIIETTVCVGIIPRQGKDAAGKALESEYYYVPERDDDESRRLAVVDGLRKPSLRNCRKQHKQYYWKKPRTP